ncbi:hypothetical protein [Rhizobium sp. L1K21]|uniref:hypothetical protein n=1 Tax=Rhizobium sp. L1K21 TaxID=2954933 RepID=UPI002092953B|nr:hypothetical protein [Rhizobium sp. L1K21]MCO6187098.1 hypothetical protein [Rhizobium sp. L1K21]
MASAIEELSPEEVRMRNILGRLELIIDNENERIGSDPEFDLKASNVQKSRCLYELTMLMKDPLTERVPDAFVSQMQELKGKLALNARRVKAHMEAVRAVADILRNAVREADADGTYSQEQFRYGEF